ncbi:MAG TPA: hypothetical protein VF691_19725, partial [Cytophagaceae bacterium]
MAFILGIRSKLLCLLLLCSCVSYSQVFNNFYSSDAVPITGNVGIATPDGGYLFGGTANNGIDLEITKIDFEGTVQWSYIYDLNKVNFPEYITGISIIKNNSSNWQGFLIVGTTYNDINTVNNSSDPFVLKVGLSGNLDWVRAFTRTDETSLYGGFDKGIKAEELNDGSIVVSMDVLGDAGILRLNENGDFLNGSAAASSKVVNAGGCCPIAFTSTEEINGGILNASSDHYIMVGEANSESNSFYYLLDFNLPSSSAPTVSFGKMLGGSPEKKSLLSVDKLPNGDYIACGYTEEDALGGIGDRDGVVMRLSNIGEVVWAKRIGSAASDSFSKIIYDALTGNVVCYGVTKKLTGNDRGVGIIMDLSGNIIIQNSLENTSLVSDINIATGNRYIITGSSQNRIHAYIANNSDLSNSACAFANPDLLPSDITVSNGNIGLPSNSPFELSEAFNNYSNSGVNQ